MRFPRQLGPDSFSRVRAVRVVSSAGKKQCSLKVMLDLHRVFTKTDFTADLRKINVPVLLVHGKRDTSALIDVTARRTAGLIPHCELKVYEDAAHGLPITHVEKLNAELLALART